MGFAHFANIGRFCCAGKRDRRRLQAHGEKVPKKTVEDKNGASTDHEQIVPESLTAQNIIIRSRTIYRQ